MDSTQAVGQPAEVTGKPGLYRSTRDTNMATSKALEETEEEEGELEQLET